MNKYIFLVFLMSFSVSAVAVDSCKFEPVKTKDNEYGCLMYIENGEVVAKVIKNINTPIVLAAPYINGNKVTLDKFRELFDAKDARILVQGLYDKDKKTVNIEKYWQTNIIRQ